MPYDYNSTSSLAHARNFKYIKREPDGKGGWRYYYDVKKHGADIKKRVENKTGITAARKDVEATKRNFASAGRKLASTSQKAGTAQYKLHNANNAEKDALERFKIAGGKYYTTDEDKMNAVKNTKNAPRVYGERYRDASIARDKAEKEYDTTAKEHESAKKEHEAAKKEYEAALEKFESIPIVKLSKDIKTGADTIKRWLKSPVATTKDILGVDEKERALESWRNLRNAKTHADYVLERNEGGSSEAIDAYDKADSKYFEAIGDYLNTPMGKIESLPYTMRGESFILEMRKRALY